MKTTRPALLVAGLYSAFFSAIGYGATSFEGIGDLPGGIFFSKAMAVSGDGRVVAGVSDSAASNPDSNNTPVDEAFRWSRDDGMLGLGLSSMVSVTGHGNEMSSAADLSEDGRHVIGWAGYGNTSHPYPVYWGPDGSLTNLGAFKFGTLPGTPIGISADGSIAVGHVSSLESWYSGRRSGSWYQWTLDPATGEVLSSKTIDHEKVQQIGPSAVKPHLHAMSANGDVLVGSFTHAKTSSDGRATFFSTEPLMWSVERGFEALGYPHGTGRDGAALAVSSDGSTVVGWVHTASPIVSEAFRWTRETGSRPLSIIGYDILSTVALGVSGDGSVVVGEASDQFGRYAFVWTEQLGLVNLQDVIEAEGIAGIEGWVLTDATDVSNDGKVIVGNGLNRDLQQEAWILEFYCDLTGDFRCDAADIDALNDAIRRGDSPPGFDLNGDDFVDAADRHHWVVSEKRTFHGDVNLDRQFNSADLVAVFFHGQYEDSIIGNSTWQTGDWNGDGDFTSSDLVLAFQDGGYEQGPRVGIQSVPEPSTSLLIAFGLLATAIVSRHQQCARRQADQRGQA